MGTKAGNEERLTHRAMPWLAAASLLVALGVAGRCATRGWRTNNDHAAGSARAGAEGGVGAALRAAGVRPRDVDDATNASLTPWYASDVEPVTVDELLQNELHDNQTMLLENYGSYRPLDGWVEGFADDGQFGMDVIDCAIRHEQKLEQACNWDNVVVLRRVNGDSGKVVYMETQLRDLSGEWKEPEPVCIAWAACVRDAWRDRDAPFPSSAKGDFFAIRARGGQTFAGFGRTGDEYRDYYKTTAEYWRSKLELPKNIDPDDPVSVMVNEHNMLHAGIISHHADLLLGRLEEGEAQ